MLAQSKDILDAVEKNSGMKVQGFVATDYNGVIEACAPSISTSPISGRSPTCSPPP